MIILTTVTIIVTISCNHWLCARHYAKNKLCIVSLNPINILLRKYYYYSHFPEFGFREIKEFAQGHKASE